MVVVLDPKTIGNTSKKPVLQTIQNSKLTRIKRVQDDLDRTYIENDTKKRAKLLQLPYVDLYGFPIDPLVLSIISSSDVKKYKIGPFAMDNMMLMLATPDPNEELHVELLERLHGLGYKTRTYLCSYFSLKKLINNYNYLIEHKEESDEIIITESKVKRYGQHVDNLQQYGNMIQTLNTSEIIDAVFVGAMVHNASDIHFEPEQDKYNVRFRLDGVLYTFAHLNKDTQKKIESRIKISSGLKLNIDNVPQDGRLSFTYEGAGIDVRVSMLPSNYGYSIVMRLLGTNSVALELDALGFQGDAKDSINRAIIRPQGLILTTGPTGSGKTTTLYTFLKTLNDGQKKIITLEDPIEYKLQGVSQTQIDTVSGYTFAAGLRSILRQDPDVVMIGEIRDKETAEIAIQASLTGHQVLSTIHTNDAAGAIPRLLEMGTRGYLLADALQAIIGQRLVRKLCPHCYKTDHLDAATKMVVLQQLSRIPEQVKSIIPPTLQFRTSIGCPECSGLGYKGRIGIYEVINISQSLKEIMEGSPRTSQIRKAAAADGSVNMLQDGIIKALQGLTDMKEVMRVANF
jgi:type II secretory ATPase GspE/PulE/Tfp pilus assembly ATPase PilB-like protein